ncbi:MAG: hypothetical protein SXQ77_05265, partial [Halobacteria archaeon]|nr:hypothetical protein [Halobacteria archaeon]
KPGRNTSGYPRKRVRTGPNWNKKVQGVMKGLKNEAHLVVPFSSVENPRTVPGPDEYGLNTPDYFIENPSLNLDPDHIPRTPENRKDTQRLDFGPPSGPEDYRTGPRVERVRIPNLCWATPSASPYSSSTSTSTPTSRGESRILT